MSVYCMDRASCNSLSFYVCIVSVKVTLGIRSQKICKASPIFSLDPVFNLLPHLQ